MGSFAMTCAISGLPIEYGDPVRYLLLTKNPYTDDNLRCHLHDLWFPRVWPLRATYNDYGSVENIEDGPARQAWLDAFQFDLIERGWGDNSCHDTSTPKDMSFEHMLTAVWEGRILVKPEVPIYPDMDLERMLAEVKKRNEPEPSRTAPDPPDGVPNLKRIEQIIVAAGFEIFDGNRHEKTAMMVDDDEGYGRIRVRVDRYGDNAPQLREAEAAIRAAGYATMITNGTGAYANNAELLVRPLPTAKDYCYHKRAEKPPLQVMQAMIREDVWQALCALQVENAWHATTDTIADFRKAVRTAWQSKITPLPPHKDVEAAIAQLLSTLPKLGGSEDRCVNVFDRDPIPFKIGLATSFRVVAKRAAQMSAEQVEAFLDNAAEFMFLHDVLDVSRYQWRPSYSNGPQFGEWKLHRQVLEAFKDIAEARHNAREQEATS